MHTNKKLEKRIAYERMLAGISEQAVSVDDLQYFLNVSLENMGRTLDVSRVFIFNYQLQSDTFCCICEWNAKNTPTLKELDELVLHIPWATQQLREGIAINCEDTRELPGACYRERLLAAKVKSTLNVPLFVKNELYGFMGFDECRVHREWIDEDVYILTTAAQIITRAIENKKYEEELNEHRNLLESIFGSVQDAIITVDKSMSVVAANKASENICGFRVKTGMPFDEVNRSCNKSCVRVLKETLNNKSSIQEYQIECGQRDQKKITAMINCSPLISGGGNFIGAVLVIRDISRLAQLEKELKERQNYQKIIGKSERMQKLYDLIEVLSKLSTTVLITGESGTGKELAARALHQAGPRATKSFVTVNCSALVESLLESELFGHIKGSFTGAERDKIGRFEAADGGTILLDEIGDISPLIQLKLLRVIQEKEFERVGEFTPRKVDVRVVASTNRDLKKSIADGSFREDLYYRLNVIDVVIPPLRERYDDIPLLVEYFCRLFNSRYFKKIEGVSAEVLEIFMHYPWPGNIRELEHVIERAFVLCSKRIISLEHIPQEIKALPSTRVQNCIGKISLENPEALLSALLATDWNISKAARKIGISRWTVYRRIQEHKLVRPV
jgi:two-component system, NtrC family, response regulator HydG